MEVPGSPHNDTETSVCVCVLLTLLGHLSLVTVTLLDSPSFNQTPTEQKTFSFFAVNFGSQLQTVVTVWSV